jgi:two-component system OmpR family sensor kinase
MMSKSLAGRLALLQQLVTVAVIVVFAASSLWITRHALVRKERAVLWETAHRVANDIEREYQEEHNLVRAASGVLEDEVTSGMRIDIVDAAGRRIASSNRAAADTVDAPRPQGDRDIQRVSIASPMGIVVTVSISDRLRDATMAALARALMLSALPLLLLTLLLSRTITRRALRPLAQMGWRAHNASVEQGVRTIGPVCGLAEIDALRESFDRLLGRLDDLLQSERRFTADASHELRTPLTVLSGELEAALTRPDLPAETRAGLTRAWEQARTMRDLVEALLLLRRSGPAGVGEREGSELMNLADLVREVTADAMHRSPLRTADLTISVPDEVLIAGHPALLGSAVRNLVDNALKFTRPGQAVRVTVQESGGAAVIVDDGGPGIPVDERERVFDPFYRGAEARAERGGLGLGLPILRQVAHVHGGSVTIEDSPLGGARVALRLPLWVGRLPATPQGAGRNE